MTLSLKTSEKIGSLKNYFKIIRSFKFILWLFSIISNSFGASLVNFFISYKFKSESLVIILAKKLFP